MARPRFRSPLALAATGAFRGTSQAFADALLPGDVALTRAAHVVRGGDGPSWMLASPRLAGAIARSVRQAVAAP